MDILRLALICLHFLAWPVVALGYPLSHVSSSNGVNNPGCTYATGAPKIASIRAVETGSVYHMRKLVTYWTLFALISLLEFAFSKIILRIPLWSTIRLVAIFWLVLPQFDGACYAYQALVRLLSSVSRQAFVNGPKEERRISTENIQENGSKAPGDLIANKQECSDPEREIQATEAKVLNASWVSILLKEPKAAKQDDGTLQIRPVKEGQQQEWRCDLCKVKASSENNLNDHLKGRQHRANCVSLKALLLNAKPEHQLKPKPSKEFQISKRHCNVCDATLLNDAQFIAHFNGKRHLSNLRKIATPDAVLSPP